VHHQTASLGCHEGTAIITVPKVHVTPAIKPKVKSLAKFWGQGCDYLVIAGRFVPHLFVARSRAI
jgi:hypothetical protein